MPPAIAMRISTRVRGTPLRVAVRWLSDRHGELGLHQLLAAIPVRFAPELNVDDPDLGILAAGWYSDELAHPLLDAVAARVEPSELPALADALGGAVMAATLTGTYRMLFEWMATPKRYGRFCQRLWHMYYDSGRIIVQVAEDGLSAECTVDKWDGHHPFICELNRAAATEIYRAMGLTSVTTVRTSCVAHGSDACRFRTTWSPAAP